MSGLGKVVLGRYRVVAELGKGGMGAVYLGRTEGAAGFTRPVVIKSVLPDFMVDPEAAKMFVREARILSELHHPGIVKVLDFGEEAGSHIMVMEYVHGYDLGRWAAYLGKQHRRLPVDQAVFVMVQVLEALDHAHRLTRSNGTPLKIVHRDVSPTNILIGVEGGVRLLDFGIARMTGETGEYRTTETSFKGKIAYAPPELLQGERPSSVSDLYSAAVVLYQVLGAKNPFKGASLTETVDNILTGILPPLREVRDDVSRDLDEVLARAMAKHPSDRYPTGSDFAKALRSTLAAPENLVAANFARDIQRDFSDAGVSSTLRVPSLSSRDAAWRRSGESTALSSSPPAVDEVLCDEPTMVTAASDPLLSEDSKTRLGMSSTPVRQDSSSVVSWMAGLFAMLAAGVFAFVWLYGRTIAPASVEYQVVDQRTAQVAAQAPGRVTPAAQPGETLREAFTRQQQPIRDCIRSGGAQLTDAGLLIRFQTDARGDVNSVALEPSELAATRTGTCVQDAARQFHFGKQAALKAFRIPVRVH